MTTYATRPTQDFLPPSKKPLSKGRLIVKWLTTTDHKTIGYLYLITSFAWFLIAGLLALAIRAELTRPGLQFLSAEQYNQVFTMHGTIMLLMFATPLFVGFANVIMPLQIGAADVAFPRMNMLSYWLYLFGGIMAFTGFLTPGGAASFGWTAYAPLSNDVYSPGIGADLWIVGLAIGGLGTILGGVNFVTTIFTMRAPGMTMFRMSIFSWNVLLTSILVLIAFPPLAAALLGLEADRLFGAQVFEPANGGAMLWQHLFWFFGHPEVYILALPFFGIATEILPVFSRKPVFGYKGLAHFHYVLFGTVVFAMFGGFYFWWPKMTGKMLNETLGKIHFWTLFIGFHTTFLIQHWLGIKGFPRRYADYLATDGFTFMNMVSTVGSTLLAISMIPFAINVWITRKSPKVEVDDPWGYGASLEWATSCPPPRHNFYSMPQIRSERPAFDLHHPQFAQKAESH
ncbi:MAG: hypothetical protein EB029_00160 [Actinobacteria bacterium]|nr:hypothetical protein [Actinomycetota bacterium]